MGGGVWSLKVVFGWFCEVCSWFRRASDWLLFVGWVAAIVLSWGNDCATSNPWGFAACRNASNQNSSSALMKPQLSTYEAMGFYGLHAWLRAFGSPKFGSGSPIM